MSDKEVFCKETTSDVETTIVDAVLVVGNEDGPQKLSPEELNDLVRDLVLSKDKAELLASCEEQQLH